MNLSAALAFQFGMTLSPPLLHALAPIWKKSEFAGGAWCALVLSSRLNNQGKEQGGIVLASNLETVLVCILLKWITLQFSLYGLKIPYLVREILLMLISSCSWIVTFSFSEFLFFFLVLFLSRFTFLLEFISGTKWSRRREEERGRGKVEGKRSKVESQWCLQILFLPLLKLLFPTNNLLDKSFVRSYWSQYRTTLSGSYLA